VPISTDDPAQTEKPLRRPMTPRSRDVRTSISEDYSASGVPRWLAACIAHSQIRYLVGASMDEGHLVPVILFPRSALHADLANSNPDCFCVSISASPVSLALFLAYY
jgi:hypothetical protein